MLLSIVAALATTLLSSVFAQEYSSSETSTSTSTTSAGATHTCSIGAYGYNFTPNTLYAEVGDVIEFIFYPLNHSVARAAFKQPCIPYEDTEAGRVGFWSGFKPISIVLSDPPTFRLPINDTEPVFFYCSAPGACFQGMVGVINPNATDNYTIQFEYSQNATEEFSPLEYFPVESVPPDRTTTATGGTAVPTAVTSPTSPSTSVVPGTSSSHSSSLSSGAIAGIAIGGAVVVLLAAALIYMCGRQKSLGEILLRQSHAHPPTNHNSYIATAPEISTVDQPSMHKQAFSSMMSGQYSDHGYRGPAAETESYRSRSPPIDEHPGMMNAVRSHQQPTTHMRNEQQSPGSPGSAAFSSPRYSQLGTHEMDPTMGTGFRPHPVHQDTGPHELSGAETSPDANTPRPFSFTGSESGYKLGSETGPTMR